MEADLRTQISEAPRATDDGYIWPVERTHMLEAGPIRERMAQDITRAIAEIIVDQCVCEDDLIRLGWSRGQILAHATAAFAEVKAARRAARLPMRQAA
jgi:hypothetical protein